MLGIMEQLRSRNFSQLSRVKSGGGVAYLHAVAGRIACKDTNPFDTFSCPLTPSPTFYKLREIERGRLQRKYEEKARRCSAASTSQCNTVLGSTSNTRAVARMPRPSARHASTRTISSTA